MAFWTQKNLEPKRGYRFTVTLGEMPAGAQFYASKVNKPKVNISKTEHKYINHTFKYPGRVEWEDVKITLVDPVDPDASQHLAGILEGAGYIIPDNDNQVTTISKENAVNALGKVVIRQLNEAVGAGVADGGTANVLNTHTIEEWTLNNAWILDVSFGDLDYDTDELTKIELTIAYDWATLKTRNGLQNPDTIRNVEQVGRPSLNSRWRR